MNIFPHSRRGQTLVEALVALSILTTGFIGIVTLLVKSFQLNRTTTSDTQATYLAAEGIEIAKNIIDYDVYYGYSFGTNTSTYQYDWGCSFALGPGESADYELDNTATASGCSPLAGKVSAQQAQSDHLYFNPVSYLYTYEQTLPATVTDFTRDVRVTAVSQNELDVQSTVAWSTGVLSNSVTLEDRFYNWHP